MRHVAIIALVVITGCNGSVRNGGPATAPPGPSAPAAPQPDPPAAPPTYPDGLVAMVGAAPQWFGGPWASDISHEVGTGGVYVAMFVNGKPVVFMDTDENGGPRAREDAVKNGVKSERASLLGPHERAFLMVGPGPYQVKTLCYSREADGSFRLFGGGLRRRREMRVVTIIGMDCRLIAAAAATP